MTEATLPQGTVLAERFLELERVYPEDPRLLAARDPSGTWCVIVADPTEPLFVAQFDTEAERDAWLDELKVSARRGKKQTGGTGGAPPEPSAAGVLSPSLEARTPPRDP